MKNVSTLALITLILATASPALAKAGDEGDVKHSYHPIVQDAKLIALHAKIWWVCEKMKTHAAGDAEQQAILTTIQENSHAMKEMVIKSLTKRIKEQTQQDDTDSTELVEELILE